MKRRIRILAAAVLVALAPLAAAQTPRPVPAVAVTTRLATSFTPLAARRRTRRPS